MPIIERSLYLVNVTRPVLISITRDVIAAMYPMDMSSFIPWPTTNPVLTRNVGRWPIVPVLPREVYCFRLLADHAGN